MKKISEWINELSDNARRNALIDCSKEVLNYDSCSLISALYTIREKGSEWKIDYDYWTGVIMELRNRNTEKVAGVAPVMDAPRLASTETDRTFGESSSSFFGYTPTNFANGYRKTESDEAESQYQD